MDSIDKKAVKSNEIIERISLLDKKIYKLQAIRNHPKKLCKTTSTLTIERTKGETKKKTRVMLFVKKKTTGKHEIRRKKFLTYSNYEI